MSGITLKLRSLGSWLWLELALNLSICLLILQIGGPTVHRWWHSPAPGTLGIDYVGEDLRVVGMSPAYFSYLPKSYWDCYPRPLVAFLHGSGNRGDNPNKVRQIAERFVESSGAETTVVVLLAQCPPRSGWQSEDVYKFVEHASRRYRIAPRRLHLVGSSMGGYGTWAVAAAHPKLFAAIVPVAGGESRDSADALAQVPTWAFHGGKASVISPEQSESLVEAIRRVDDSPKLPAGGIDCR